MWFYYYKLTWNKNIQKFNSIHFKTLEWNPRESIINGIILLIEKDPYIKDCSPFTPVM